MEQTLKDIIDSNLKAGGKIHALNNEYAKDTAKVINQHNPAMSQQVPWRMARARENFVNIVTFPLQFWTNYFKAFVSVLYPEPKKYENL